jgi:hypothetical protein
MAIIGRAAAVADFGKVRLAGFGAWLMWLFVHLINLIEYQNRLLVLIQWAWAYFTRKRSGPPHHRPKIIAGSCLAKNSETERVKATGG